jgi:tagatose-6-phosphate ketose/aldose isomerase
VFDDALPLARALAAARYERVIFLGANALKGLAREAALKLLELTDGRVAALADTPLGFRHGPKTIVNARTLVVLFVSGDAYARRYDLDLLGELRRDGVAARVVALAADPAALAAGDFLVPGSANATDLGLCFAYVAFAQCLALLQSLSLGITPDNPNPSGTVNRVVRGVSIYPLEAP